MNRLMQNKRVLVKLAPLAMLLIAYLVWANVEGVREMHGSWVTDFGNPRYVLGFADAAFVGRVVAQEGTGEAQPHIPQTQFKVEVLQTIKSVRRLNSEKAESLPAEPVALPPTLTINQNGGHERDAMGKRVLVLMDDQPLLVLGQSYVVAVRHDAAHNWYNLLPQGAVAVSSLQTAAPVVDTFTQAYHNEIPFDFQPASSSKSATP